MNCTEQVGKYLEYCEFIKGLDRNTHLRDWKGEFEPQVVKKHQNTVARDMEEKIISMYAKEMTTNDIESRMWELYAIEISDSTISRIMDKILPIVQNRKIMEGQLGESFNIFQVSRSGLPINLYHECHRGI